MTTEAEPTAVRTSADCCTVEVDPRIARHFDRRIAELTTGGALPEMVKVSRALLELLSDVGDRRPTLLELGCGSGAMAVTLLERGAERADGVDLSPGNVAVAQRRAAQAGVVDRASFQVGDGAQVALEPHDWVVLDRVMCCYPDIERLLANSVGAAGQRYAFSIPDPRGWRGLVSRTIVGLENITNRLRGRPCPGYVHDLALIERRLSEAGLRRHSAQTVGLWYAAVWERGSAST